MAPGRRPITGRRRARSGEPGESPSFVSSPDLSKYRTARPTRGLAMTISKQALKTAAQIAGAAVLYYAAARLSLHLAFENTNASPVWPPSGIALALVLLLGYRVWPGILLGAFLANFT